MMRGMPAFDLVHRAADLVLGARCPGCGAPSLGLCDGCAAILGDSTVQPISRPLPGFPCTVVAGEYRDVLKGVILAAKERGSLGMVPVLANLLVRCVARLLTEADPVPLPVVMVPVPTAREHVIERGLDLTGTLATRVARTLRTAGLAIEARPVLQMAGRPLDQAGLGVAERVGNVGGVFEARRTITGGALVIVDDVVTTGATLAEAVRACQQGGMSPVGAVAVADTHKRGGAR